MRPDGGTKRQQEAVTNASADGDDGMSRKRMKSEPAMKEEAPDEERTLYDFNTVYDYLESTKPKCKCRMQTVFRTSVWTSYYIACLILRSTTKGLLQKILARTTSHRNSPAGP